MRIGELLVEQQKLRPGELARVVADQPPDRRLCSFLISQGLVDFDDASRALGEQHGVPCALSKHLTGRDPELATLLPGEVGRAWCALPIGRTSRGELIVCVRDPSPAVYAQLVQATRTEVLMVVSPASRLENLVRAAYGAAPSDELDIDVDLDSDAPQVRVAGQPAAPTARPATPPTRTSGEYGVSPARAATPPTRTSGEYGESPARPATPPTRTSGEYGVSPARPATPPPRTTGELAVPPLSPPASAAPPRATAPAVPLPASSPSSSPTARPSAPPGSVAGPPPPAVPRPPSPAAASSTVSPSPSPAASPPARPSAAAMQASTLPAAPPARPTATAMPASTPPAAPPARPTVETAAAGDRSDKTTPSVGVPVIPPEAMADGRREHITPSMGIPVIPPEAMADGGREHKTPSMGVRIIPVEATRAADPPRAVSAHTLKRAASEAGGSGPVMRDRALSTESRHTLPMSISMMSVGLEHAASRENATDLVLAYVATRWRAAIVFDLRDGHAIGFRGHGVASPEQATIPLALPSTLTDAIDGEMVSAEAPASSSQSALSLALGRPNTVTAAPIRIDGTPGAVIAVGDLIDRELPVELAEAELRMLADSLGAALGRIAAR